MDTHTEKKAGHTPGEWHAITRERYTLGGDMVEIVTLNEDGMITDQIASVMLETGEDTEEDRVVYKQQEANAVLMAASRELLSVCKKLTAMIGDVSDKKLWPTLGPVADELRGAIAKAEGRGE